MKKFNNRENERVELPDGREAWLSRSIAVVASVAVICKDKLYLLISKRGQGASDFNGLYNCICGYLDWNESSWDCFKREVYEESGLDIDEMGSNLLDEKPWDVTSDPIENKQNIVIHHWFLGKVDELPKINVTNHIEENEVEETIWIQYEDYSNFEYAFGHKERIKKFLNNVLNQINFGITDMIQSKNQKFSIGDTVEVYCEFLSSQKFIHKIIDIQDEWLIFDGDNGKIQKEYCIKI